MTKCEWRIYGYYDHDWQDYRYLDPMSDRSLCAPLSGIQIYQQK